MTYIDVLKTKTADIRRKTKEGLTRDDRIPLVDSCGSDYALAHATLKDELQAKEDASAAENKRKPKVLPFNPPDAHLIGNLADLLLYEELTDTTSNKATSTEYPFLSEYQLARRREGSHEQAGANQKGEVTLNAALNVGTDGRDYRVPVRRKRSNLEGIRIDSASRSRNKAMRERYNAAIKPGPVTTYSFAELAVRSV